jgi:hypothetical protein
MRQEQGSGERENKAMAEKHFRFQDLEIWQRGAALSRRLFALADQLDERKRYRFAEQLRAATLSRNQAVERSADALVRGSTVPVTELSPDSAEAPNREADLGQSRPSSVAPAALADEGVRAPSPSLRLSLTNHIAEGSGSVHRREFIQFLSIARRSLFEDVSRLMVFEKIGRINSAELDGRIWTLPPQSAPSPRSEVRGEGARGEGRLTAWLGTFWRTSSPRPSPPLQACMDLGQG